MAHHGNSDIPPGMNKLLDELLTKQTKEHYGEYPNGRLNKDDRGAVACAIGHENGVVKMQFPYDLKWIGFTPEQAIEIAQMLIQHARKCGAQSHSALWFDSETT